MQCHFISGLPRSGSTLLASILNQNPAFYSTISNPLARFVRSIIIESHVDLAYALQCPEQKRIELIRALVSTYHNDPDKKCFFNTNRGWTSMMPILEKTHPQSKVICCVRDIAWILDSFEVLFRKNPFSLSRLYSESEAENVYSRAYSLMSPSHTVRFAYDSLKEALVGPQKKNLFIVEYEQLAKNPEMVMKSLHNFIGEPYFEYDFDNVESSYDEFDAEVNIPGLHKIRKKVELVQRDPILPPDLWNEFRGLEVWR